jgi:hypothetical protein
LADEEILNEVNQEESTEETQAEVVEEADSIPEEEKD